MAQALIIFLHGAGSNGEDLAVLGEQWAGLLPDVAFAAPDAPWPFEHAMGYQWFSLTGVTPENRPARVRAARAAFEEMLQQLMARHNMADAWDKVILVGFSQGAIMALDALASGRYPLAGVVAFSGRLAFDATPTPQPWASALLIHGKADDVIPWSETQSAASRLQAAGVHITVSYEAATGHTISPQGAMQAVTYIAQCLQD